MARCRWVEPSNGTNGREDEAFWLDIERIVVVCAGVSRGATNAGRLQNSNFAKVICLRGEFVSSDDEHAFGADGNR